MSYASTILEELAYSGISVQLDDGMLVPRGPRSLLINELLAALRRHKSDIVALLRRRSIYDDRGAIAQRLADAADAYAERFAIVMEAGDIEEAEASLIAEAEIGRRFFEVFVVGGEGLREASLSFRGSD